jgi:hypothetical protein
MEMPTTTDALMCREAGENWDVKRVPRHRIAGYREGGWVLLLDSADLPPTRPAKIRPNAEAT